METLKGNISINSWRIIEVYRLGKGKIMDKINIIIDEMKWLWRDNEYIKITNWANSNQIVERIARRPGFQFLNIFFNI